MLHAHDPITGEKLSHICRYGPRPVPENLRREILALDARNVSPWKIADHLRVSDKTVLRIISGDDVDAAACPPV